MTADQPTIEDIKRLTVHPGETLVVTVTGPVTLEVFEEIREKVRRNMPQDVEVLVVNDQVSLSVVAKPRILASLHGLTGQQRDELETWLATFHLTTADVIHAQVTDTDVTITAFRRNAEGKWYANGDEAATAHITVPLTDAPSWLADIV
jgi:hypothetical protein